MMGMTVAVAVGSVAMTVTTPMLMVPQPGKRHDQQAAEPEAEKNEVRVHRATRTAALREELSTEPDALKLRPGARLGV